MAKMRFITGSCYLLLVGVGLVHAGENNDKLSCVSCDDADSCDKNVTSIPCDDNSMGCLAYKYYKADEDKIYTYKGCTAKEFTCDNFIESNKTIVQCNHCEINNCNKNFGKDNLRELCVSCDPCPETLNKTNFCRLNDKDGNTACVAYQYTKDKQTITVRGCGKKNQCNSLKSKELRMCNSWDNPTDNFANSEINKDRKTCVSCSSDKKDQSYCANATVNNTTLTCYVDDTVNTECYARSYLSGVTEVTSRGCGPSTQCDDENSTENTKLCRHCDPLQKESCSESLDVSKDAPVLCIKCTGTEGESCGNNEMEGDRVTSYCKLSNNQRCVLYKFFDGETNKSVWKRDCVVKDQSCDSLNEKDTTKNCHQCSEDVCNQKFAAGEIEKTLCVECSGIDCEGFNITIDKYTKFCKLSSTSSEQCTTYKNYEVSSQSFKWHRKCAAKDHCSTLEKSQTMTYCEQCDGENCNTRGDQSLEKTLCVHCEGDENSECAKDEVNFSTNQTSICRLDNTTERHCVTHKYQKGAQLMTYRGCEPIHYCDSQNSLNNSVFCSGCTGHVCNKKVNETDSKVLCIDCTGGPGTDCYSDSHVADKVQNYCSSATKKCLKHKYLKGNEVLIRRFCSPSNGCTTDPFNATSTLFCAECSGEICNSNINPSNEKVLCIQCRSDTNDDCALDAMNLTKLNSYCPIDGANTCLVYKYVKDGKNVIVRGCDVAGKCDILKVDGAVDGKLLGCQECNYGNLCNKDIITDGGSNGAPSVIAFALLPVMLAQVLV